MALQVKIQETQSPPQPWPPELPHLLFVGLLLLWADKTFSLLVLKCENSPGHWLPVLYQIFLTITVF